jgi:hypothetical protein
MRTLSGWVKRARYRFVSCRRIDFFRCKKTIRTLPPCRSAFYEISWRPFLVIGDGAGGVAEALFFGGKEFFEPVFERSFNRGLRGFRRISK